MTQYRGWEEEWGSKGCLSNSQQDRQMAVQCSVRGAKRKECFRKGISTLLRDRVRWARRNGYWVCHKGHEWLWEGGGPWTGWQRKRPSLCLQSSDNVVTETQPLLSNTFSRGSTWLLRVPMLPWKPRVMPHISWFKGPQRLGSLHFHLRPSPTGRWMCQHWHKCLWECKFFL